MVFANLNQLVARRKQSFALTAPCRRGKVVRGVLFVVALSYAFSLMSLHVLLSSKSHPVDSVQTERQMTVVLAPPGREEVLETKAKEPKALQQVAKKKETIVEIVDTSSWAIPSASYIIDSADLWERPENNVADWMKHYLRWHKEQTSLHVWTTESFKLPNNYLFVSCLAEYNKCGGTADRLLSLPFFVKFAAATKRVLVIQWTKPAPLEEFLLPPVNGIDWRVHRGLDVALLREGFKVGTQDTILQFGVQANVTVLQAKFQSHDHGSVYYDTFRETPDELDFESVFHIVWRIFFTPSPALAKSIDDAMKKADLAPGHYTAAHLRALYQTNQRDIRVVQTWTDNAIHCALKLQQPTIGKLPVYFASDSDQAVRHAIYYGKKHSVHVVTQPEVDHSENSLHLDKTKNWKERHASDFFGIFIDLYLMSLGKCVAYGIGGFGKFASLISSSPMCSVVHMTATSNELCDLPASALHRRGTGSHPTAIHYEHVDLSSLFLPPMTGHNNHMRVHFHPNLDLNNPSNKVSEPVPTEPPLPKKKRLIVVHQQDT